MTGFSPQTNELQCILYYMDISSIIDSYRKNIIIPIVYTLDYRVRKQGKVSLILAMLRELTVHQYKYCH